MVDEHVAVRTVLDEQVAELERLGFMISSPSDSEIVATRGKWYWDCLFTHLTVVVFLKATTGVLSWSQITDETDELLGRARDVFQGLREGWLKLRVDRAFPLAQAAEAHRLLEGRQTAGKLILKTGS